MLSPIIRNVSFGRAASPGWPRFGWKTAGAVALLCSGVAFASLPGSVAASPSDQQRQWDALGVMPLADRGATGLPMAPTGLAQSVGVIPRREARAVSRPAPAERPLPPAMALRIRGTAGDGLYWSLRAAGASPEVAAEYLSALATEIDVGEVSPSDSFDMVLSPSHDLLYAGLARVGRSVLQLVRWNANGRSEWIDVASLDQPARVESSLAMPAQGPITSYFGYRYHPILHFTRFHAGVDIGATWGSPIVAAGDGRVVAAGWGGGYGHEVEIAHGGGLVSLYGHMSQIVAQPGSFVRRGQLIGYVGSSGLSTGPHLHFEVRQGGSPVNPLAVHFTGASVVDTHLADAVRARLKTLLGTGSTRPVAGT